LTVSGTGNATGTTAINGGAVTTSGAQTYGDNVSIGSTNATLTTTTPATAIVNKDLHGFRGTKRMTD